MVRTACLLLLTTPLLAQPLLAQSPLRASRHAGLPSPLFALMFAVGDVDGDGDLDIVAAADSSPLRLLLNDGGGRFTDAPAGRLVSPPGIDCHAVDLADIDGDGDLDVLAANEDFTPNLVFTNDGFGVFRDVTAGAMPPIANNRDTKKQVVADFDNDGDVDWLAFDWPTATFYENNGLGVFTDTTAARLLGLPTFLGDEWVPNAPAVDIDGDGDLDVVISSTLLLNQAGVLTPSPVPLPTLASSMQWFADVDGDGDQDMFTRSGRTLLQNQGDGTFVDVTAAAFPTAPTGAIAALDLDGDGDVDLLTATRIWRNDGTGTFVDTLLPTTFPLGAQLAVPADYDGDGDLDLPGLVNFLRQVDAPGAPTSGSSYAVDFHTRPGSNSFVVAAAAFGASAVPTPFGMLRLDPATAVVLTARPANTNPLTLQWTLPNVPGTVGTALHYQALILDPVQGARLSNSIRDVVQ